MKTQKNTNWLLIGSLLFFLVSAGFTTVNSNNAFLNPDDDIECYVCAADGCDEAQDDQIGKTDCEDAGDCELTGEYFCVEDPVEG